MAQFAIPHYASVKVASLLVDFPSLFWSEGSPTTTNTKFVEVCLRLPMYVPVAPRSFSTPYLEIAAAGAKRPANFVEFGAGRFCGKSRRPAANPK